MIKMLATNENGDPILILGLSRANCEHLLAGKPIAFPTDRIPMTKAPVHIIILGGETEQSIVDEMSKHVPLPKPGSAS